MRSTLVDTHCHLDFDRFDDDREEVIQRAVDAGVMVIIVPGLDLDISLRAVTLAGRHREVYAAVGVHPNDIRPGGGSLKNTLTQIRELARHRKVVAIGEVGLDYYWDKTPLAIQHVWLTAQLELAAELELPVILHNREATADLLDVLADWAGEGLPAELTGRRGVLHSFSGTWEDAQVALDLGFYLGFTGPITYKKADEMRRVAQNAPTDRILVETDAPFLTPHPHRGQRNEPAFVRFTAIRLAEVRGCDLETIAAQTTSNATALFSRLEVSTST